MTSIRPRDYSLVSPALPDMKSSHEIGVTDKETIKILQNIIRIKDSKIEEQSKEINRLNELLDEIHPPIRPLKTATDISLNLSPPPPTLSNLRDGLKSALERIQQDVNVINLESMAIKRERSVNTNTE